MFSYYGSKSKLVHLYPRPLYPRIIEPFCGSARYALKYWKHDVWINDVSPTIYGIWKWIQQASKDDIRKLPELKKGESLKDIKWLSQPERDLLGFCTSLGCSSPTYVSTGWASQVKFIGIMKRKALTYVGRIRHWSITNLSYEEITAEQATWFIDPPYQGEAGLLYPHTRSILLPWADGA